MYIFTENDCAHNIPDSKMLNVSKLYAFNFFIRNRWMGEKDIQRTLNTMNLMA